MKISRYIVDTSYLELMGSEYIHILNHYLHLHSSCHTKYSFARLSKWHLWHSIIWWRYFSLFREIIISCLAISKPLSFFFFPPSKLLYFRNIYQLNHTWKTTNLPEYWYLKSALWQAHTSFSTQVLVP